MERFGADWAGRQFVPLTRESLNDHKMSVAARPGIRSVRTALEVDSGRLKRRRRRYPAFRSRDGESGDAGKMTWRCVRARRVALSGRGLGGLITGRVVQHACKRKTAVVLHRLWAIGSVPAIQTPRRLSRARVNDVNPLPFGFNGSSRHWNSK